MHDKLKRLSKILVSFGLDIEAKEVVKLASKGYPRISGTWPCQAYITLLQHYRGLEGVRLKETQMSLDSPDPETNQQCSIESNKLMKEEAIRRGVSIADIRKEYRDLRAGRVQLGKPLYPVIEHAGAPLEPEELNKDEEWGADPEPEETDGVASAPTSFGTPPDVIGDVISGTLKGFIGKK